MIAFNFATMQEYSGANAKLEGNGKYPAFATFLQIQQLGYHINKGAHGVTIFTGTYLKHDDATGEDKRVPKYARVFDVVDTNALQDRDFVEMLEGTKPTPSGRQVDQEIVAAMAAGSKGVERVQSAYNAVRSAGLNMPKKSKKIAKVAA